eukprot:2917062-Alexandrium_andersonii.AAC.1
MQSQWQLPACTTRFRAVVHAVGRFRGGSTPSSADNPGKLLSMDRPAPNVEQQTYNTASSSLQQLRA